MEPRFSTLARRVHPAIATVALVLVAALLAYLGAAWLDLQSLSLFFVVPIVLCAIGYGLRASLGASLLSVLAINLLFVEPRFTLAIARAQDVAALVLFAIVGALVSFIAERARMAERARTEVARERFKSELLAGVSHDLRTPLATIIFTLQSLQRFAADHPPASRDELLALAESEARRLASLVDTLLASSRLEAGASPVHLEPVSVSDLSAAALSECRAELGSRNIALSIPEGLPLVLADSALAVRALTNVLSNALKYAGASPVTMSARCADHNVIVEIADSGPGLGENPERLFTKFARGVSGDGRPPGLGLGLSLSRGFLESQGATIAAANRPGGGAVFALSFPCWTKAARDAG